MQTPRLPLRPLLAALALVAASGASQAAASFVNGLVLPGAMLDLSGGSDANTGRVGYFSDIYYDRSRNEWWGLSDRGPGGGTIPYETRVQRFSLDVNATTGAISNFQIRETLKFRDASGQAFNGLAPSSSSVLGRAFDPEGFVINPRNGNLIVSDEYGPSLYEFDRSGRLVQQYATPANLQPKAAGGALDYNVAPGSQSAGREMNRGMEGLAISPDGRYAYGMLQNGSIQDGWSADARGAYTRIVKYDTETGQALGQYAYKLESSGQGRGISALVALGDDKFMVLERNNRGIGVGATLASPDKNVFFIDLAGAADVSGVTLPASGSFAGAVAKGAKYIDLDANTLAALGNKSPEKWEGLAVGPKLADGSYLILAGTDNDYSVTQNAGGAQFDVYFRFGDKDPFATAIQCPLGQLTGCTGAASAVPADGSYQLLPGVLHAYKSGVNDFSYTAAVPEPSSYALLLAGLGVVGALARRRRPA